MFLQTEDAKDIVIIKDRPIQYKNVLYLNGKPILKFTETNDATFVEDLT
jgi:hypothetical protein